MRVRLRWHTPEPEKFMAYVARVSNPRNQENPDYVRLLRYCMRHGHWSVFEHAYMGLEIEAPENLYTEILQHKSFSTTLCNGKLFVTGNCRSWIHYFMRRCKAPGEHQCLAWKCKSIFQGVFPDCADAMEEAPCT